MKKKSAKLNLLPHSEAKVKLYGEYLSIYLNVLSRVSYIHRIYLFDLLCGEGKYENGGEGSPLIALQSIKEHYFANNKACPNMEIWFNDNEDSEIEPGIAKIERVERLSKDYFIPNNVRLRFFREDFNLILNRALAEIGRAPNAKGLFFIDPYGYKNIEPNLIKRIMANRNSEVILFLPISFMYRFANSALKGSFPGSDPLADFLIELFKGTSIPIFRSAYDFIDKLKVRFEDYLATESVYIDTFIIERDPTNIYCLFFFTCNIRGLEKMLEAKWTLDSERGRGYSTKQGIMLLTEAELRGYPNKLQGFLKSDPLKTNKQVYEFGLKHGFLPKHTADIFRRWQREGHLEVISVDGKKVRKNAFYIAYNHSRRVRYRIVSH